MDRKNNSTNIPKNINNHIIYNLKSTSQRISLNNMNEQNKNNNDQDQKSISELFQNQLINSSQNDKSSKFNKNITSDDISLDNISNILSQKQNKIPNTHMFFEDNESSFGDRQNLKNINHKNLNNINSFSNTNIEVCDSHTKSFHLKMKKMKEMNKTIMKENYITKNNKTFNATSKNGKNINSDLPIINFKQKIIYMKNKNELLNNGNIHFDDTQNNNSSGSFNINNIINENNNNKKMEENKTIPFLCCFSKS